MRPISTEGLPEAARRALAAAENTTHARQRRSHLVKFVAFVRERGEDADAPSLAEVCAYLSDFVERNGSANSLDKVLSFPLDPGANPRTRCCVW